MIFWIKHYSLLVVQIIGMVFGIFLVFIWLAVSIPLLITAGLVMNRNMIKVLQDLNLDGVKPMFR